MAILEKSFPQNLATLAHFFHKKSFESITLDFFFVSKWPKKTPNNN
jgi:hypothetical protein